MILVVGILSLGACGSQTTHYVSEEFGYSVDYPKDWIVEELSSTSIGIKPAYNAFNQIQIFAYAGQPLASSMSDLLIIEMYDANLRQSLNASGYTDIDIPVNTGGEDKWDWEIAFTATYEGFPIQGGEFIKETESMTYTVFYIQSGDWLEGQEVMDSFSLTENETEANNGN
jgi:hypothetical protein